MISASSLTGCWTNFQLHRSWQDKSGGIDLNKARMRWVIEAVITLSPSPGGFTASELANQVRALGKQSASEYDARRAAYDLKKLRGKRSCGASAKTRRYESLPKGLRAMAALVVPRNKAIKPLLAAARSYGPHVVRKTQSARRPLRNDSHRHAGCIPATGTGRLKIDNYFVGLRPLSAYV